MSTTKPAVIFSTGTHRNGEKYARADISERGIKARAEGTGNTDDDAALALLSLLMELADIAEDAANQVGINMAAE